MCCLFVGNAKLGGTVLLRNVKILGKPGRALLQKSGRRDVSGTLRSVHCFRGCCDCAWREEARGVCAKGKEDNCMNPTRSSSFPFYRAKTVQLLEYSSNDSTSFEAAASSCHV